jgi:hypothetical protein
MHTLEVIVNLAVEAERGPEVTESRLLQICKYIFSLGPAWNPARGLVVVRTARPIQEVSEHVSKMLVEGEFSFVLKLDPSAEALYAGWLVEPDELAELFPNALETRANKP